MTATTRRVLRASNPQSATYVELFFDLVFVFAVTQVTAVTAHDLTAVGVFRSILLFWLIWWAWTQFTWTLNPADATHTGVRLITLVATGAAFVMATSVPRAFGEEALWFAIPYVVVRVLGLGLQVRLEHERSGSSHAGVWNWAALSVVGLALVLAGALANPSIRTLLWLLAIVADLVAAGTAARKQQWDLNPAHLSERHGLFVIIALGESLIVAATGLAGEARTGPLVGVAAAALVVACLLWWTYFDWLQGALEDGIAAVTPDRLGSLARDAFSLSHFPLVCGIIGFAVAIEEMVAHPDEPAPTTVIAALGLGVALFVGFSALSFWFLYRRVLVARGVVLGGMAVALVAVASLSAVWPLVVVAVALTALIVFEAGSPAVTRASDRP